MEERMQVGPMNDKRLRECDKVGWVKIERKKVKYKKFESKMVEGRTKEGLIQNL